MLKGCILLLLILITCGDTTALAQASLSANLVEFHPRGNLPNFFKKIKSGKEVTIAYIGGSITEAVNGWSDKTFNWFVGDLLIVGKLLK